MAYLRVNCYCTTRWTLCYMPELMLHIKLLTYYMLLVLQKSMQYDDDWRIQSKRQQVIFRAQVRTLSLHLQKKKKSNPGASIGKLEKFCVNGLFVFKLLLCNPSSFEDFVAYTPQLMLQNWRDCVIRVFAERFDCVT